MFESIIQLLHTLWALILNFALSLSHSFIFEPKPELQLPVVAPTYVSPPSARITGRRGTTQLLPATAKSWRIPRHCVERNRKTKAREVAFKKSHVAPRPDIRSLPISKPIPYFKDETPSSYYDEYRPGRIPYSHNLPFSAAAPPSGNVTLSLIADSSHLALPPSPMSVASGSTASSVSTAFTSPPLTPGVSFAHPVPRIVMPSAPHTVDDNLEDLESGLAISGLAKRRGFKGAPLFMSGVPKKSSLAFYSLSGILSPRSPFTPDASGLVSTVSHLMRSSSPRTSNFEQEPLEQYIQDGYVEADPFATFTESYHLRDEIPVPTALSENLYDISIYINVVVPKSESLKGKNSARRHLLPVTTKKFTKRAKTNIYDMSIYDVCSEQSPIPNRKRGFTAKPSVRKQTQSSNFEKQRPYTAPYLLPLSERCDSPEIRLTPPSAPPSPGRPGLLAFTAPCLRDQSLAPGDDTQITIQSPPYGGPGVLRDQVESVQHVASLPPAAADKRQSGIRPLILPLRVAKRNSSPEISCGHEASIVSRHSTPPSVCATDRLAAAVDDYNTSIGQRQSTALNEIILLLDSPDTELVALEVGNDTLDSEQEQWSEESMVAV